MRTIVEIPKEQIEAMDQLRKNKHVSRTELIRQAVDSFLKEQRQAQGHAAFGIWKTKPVDALAWERKLRKEWDGVGVDRRGSRGSRPSPAR